MKSVLTNQLHTMQCINFKVHLILSYLEKSKTCYRWGSCTTYPYTQKHTEIIQNLHCFGLLSKKSEKLSF